MYHPYTWFFNKKYRRNRKPMNKNEKKASAAKQDQEPKSTGSKVSLVIGIVLCVILIPILIINCSLIVVGFTQPDRPPSLFGYTPMIVLTDSMEPLINEGDIIIAKSCDPADVEEGDVISFFDPASPTDAILTHRVISIYEEDGVRYANTAGDNNANSDYERDRRNASNSETDPTGKLAEVEAKATIKTDANRPDYEYVVYEGHKDSKPVELNEKELVGTYSYTRLPMVGKVSMFMQTTWGWVICIAVPLVLFLAYELISRKKNDKSKAKDMDALLAELEALKAAKAAADGASAPEADSSDANAIESNEATDAPTDSNNTEE